MKAKKIILSTTVKAGEILVANRYVEFDGTYPNAGGATYGVTQAKANKDELVSVSILGIETVIAGGAIAVGDAIKVDASGQALAWTTGAVQVGRAVSAAVASGDEISVLLQIN